MLEACLQRLDGPNIEFRRNNLIRCLLVDQRCVDIDEYSNSGVKRRIVSNSSRDFLDKGSKDGHSMSSTPGSRSCDQSMRELLIL